MRGEGSNERQSFRPAFARRASGERRLPRRSCAATKAGQAHDENRLLLRLHPAIRKRPTALLHRIHRESGYSSGSSQLWRRPAYRQSSPLADLNRHCLQRSRASPRVRALSEVALRPGVRQEAIVTYVARRCTVATHGGDGPSKTFRIGSTSWGYGSNERHRPDRPSLGPGGTSEGCRTGRRVPNRQRKVAR